MINKTLRKATAERHAKAEALRGDLPGSDRAGVEKDDGRRC